MVREGSRKLECEKIENGVKQLLLWIDSKITENISTHLLLHLYNQKVRNLNESLAFSMLSAYLIHKIIEFVT